jgi:hypothetical protein
MFARLKDWRRIHTRYDRCAHTFLSAIAFAASFIFWLTEPRRSQYRSSASASGSAALSALGGDANCPAQDCRTLFLRIEREPH